MAAHTYNLADVSSFQAFASKLSTNLTAGEVDASFVPNLRRFVDVIFTISDATAAIADSQAFDDHGTKIWNHARRLRPSGGDGSELQCLGMRSIKMDIPYPSHRSSSSLRLPPT